MRLVGVPSCTSTKTGCLSWSYHNRPVAPWFVRSTQLVPSLPCFLDVLLVHIRVSYVFVASQTFTFKYISFIFDVTMLTGLRRRWSVVSNPPEGRSPLMPAIILCTMGAFGEVCLTSTHMYLIEQAACRKYFGAYDPAQIGFNGLMDEELCKIAPVQTQVAQINGLYAVLGFIPPIFLTGPYGKMAKILGKKKIMLLNVSSLTLAGLYFTLVCYFYNTFDIRWIYLTPFLDIIGGGQVIMASFIMTYISECVNSKRLSHVFYRLSALQLLFAFFAMLVSSVTLRRNVWVQCLIGIIVLICMIPICLLFPDSRRTFLAPPQRPTLIPSSPEDSASDDSDSITSSQSSSETTSLLPIGPLTPEDPDSQPALFRTIFSALASHTTHSLSLFHSIIYANKFSRYTLFTYFMLTLGTGIRIIFAQWGSITFDWLFAEVNAITGFEMVVSGIILVSLPYITHSLLKPRLGSSSSVDIFVTKASVLAHAVGVVLIGFAPSRVGFIFSMTIWTLGSGLGASLRSFCTGMMESREAIEEIYLGIGMMETLANIVSTASWSAAFSEVLEMKYWVMRLPFMVSSSLLVVVFACVWVLGRFDRVLPTMSEGLMNDDHDSNESDDML
ncbi:uncharacterized protein LY89DRAFT_726106 [Mollisia scopiformis]|uniref:Uncharacterized protein n=1 Tax=Mollisia scopiformis TaxID=149040 RepID=A0A132B506_MOLSC|nr:uncharacterized protein LY89DRAFT_726106 [Mollisia scopiformis]KUJ06974.1 hypothetical protein LY89DRAFT_726106 [Mollisia scopiformis]